MRFSVNVLPAAIALASFMTREADAIYLPGIVRLFRGDQDDPLDGGTLNDSIDGMHMQFLGSGLTYPDETPYGDDTRKVFHFSAQGEASGSGLGLPTGDASRTIMAWIKVSTTNPGWIPFGYGPNLNRQKNSSFFLFLVESNYMIDQAYHVVEASGRHTIPIDQWFHVAVTYDNVSGYNLIYENGEEKGRGIDSQKTTAVDNQLNTWLGGVQDRDHLRFNGHIADYAIFNRTLSAQEIQSIYRSKLGLVAEAPPALTEKDKYSMSLVPDSAVVAFDTSSNKNEIVFDLKLSSEIDLSELRDTSTIFDHANCTEAIDAKFISAKPDKTNTFLNDMNSNFVNVPVLVDVQTDKFGESDIPSGYYTTNADTNKVRLKFCVKTDLGQSNIIKLDANGNELPVDETSTSSISYTKVKFDITIDMVTGFTTDLIIEEKSASTASDSVKIAYTLNAFECNDDDTTITNPSNKNQNSMVRICIQTPENNDVVIASIKDFKLKSDSIVSNAISGSDANTLTTVSGEGSKKVAVTTQMVSAFFSDLQPDTASTITVEGTAVMEFKATGERRLVRISSNQKNGNVSDMDRKLDGDAGLGEFEMKVGISKSSSEENGAATSGASNALSVAPLMTVTSLALGGVLMGTMF